MKNIIEYVENEMNTFDTKAFNSVDSLVLSQLTYVYFENIVPDAADAAPSVCIKDLLKAELFDSMLHDVRDAASNRRLLFALAASPRFRDVKMNYYIDKIDSVMETQLSAVTYLLKDRTAYVAYRGTDATFIGWKEDFNMAFMSPVPAQEEGVRYLDSLAELLSGTKGIRIGGHSKGGNIAVYSAMKCNPALQERIIGVYDHDGPGFRADVLESSDFAKINERIYKTMPQSSLIGMMLEQQENYSVVESNRVGVMQHDPFSWSVAEDDFCYAAKITSGAMYMHRTVNQWLATLTDEQRGVFVDTLFQIVKSTETSTINEFSEDWRKSAAAMLEAIKNVDGETKKFVLQTINELVKLSFKNLHRSKKLTHIHSSKMNRNTLTEPKDRLKNET